MQISFWYAMQRIRMLVVLFCSFAVKMEQSRRACSTRDASVTAQWCNLGQCSIIALIFLSNRHEAGCGEIWDELSSASLVPTIQLLSQNKFNSRLMLDSTYLLISVNGCWVQDQCDRPTASVSSCVGCYNYYGGAFWEQWFTRLSSRRSSSDFTLKPPSRHLHHLWQLLLSAEIQHVFDDMCQKLNFARKLRVIRLTNAFRPIIMIMCSVYQSSGVPEIRRYVSADRYLAVADIRNSHG